MTKNLKLTALLAASFFLFAGCSGSIDKDPKVAVQNGIQQLLSKSFDFESEITITTNKEDEKKEGKTASEIEIEKALAALTQNPEMEFYGRLADSTKFVFRGSLDSKAKTLTSEFSTQLKMKNVDLAINIPMFIDPNKSEVIFGLYDFNAMLMGRDMKIEDMDKAIRIKHDNIKNQLDFAGIKKYGDFFEKIDPKSFVLVDTDETDKALGGKARIRLTLAQQDYEVLKGINKDLTAEDITSLIQTNLNVFDFTLNAKGQLIRVSQTATPPVPMIPTKQPNVIVSTVFKDAGSLKLSFAPKEEEIIEYNNPLFSNSQPTAEQPALNSEPEQPESNTEPEQPALNSEPSPVSSIETSEQ